jgi:NAD(P) transhydrogenase
MWTDAYDVVVIGAGPAGQSAAELASFLGHSALVVERASPGGVVTTTGGAPTKTLRELALALEAERQNRHAEGGSPIPTTDVLPSLRTRTLDTCRTLQTVIARQLDARGIAYVRGSARLLANRRIVVESADGDRREVTARTIVLAPGSRPVRFAGVPFDDPDVYDSNEIFSLEALPDDVVIAGAGPVGVEFATIFNALGTRVTVVDRSDRLLPNMDGELTDLMRAEFARRRVDLILGAGVDAVARRNGTLTVTLSNGTRIDTGAVLFAAGRVANTDGLGLDTAGVAVDSRGRIVVDRYFQTTADGIYAVGDAVGPTLASIAAQQGRAAVAHALGLGFGVPIDRTPSAAVYAMPELAGVGATEEQIRSSGTPYVVGRCDLSQTARGAIAGRGGRLKLVVRADDRKLLGVHCIGDIASELVGMGHAVLHMGGAIEVFLTLALNTPTYSYAYRDAAIDAMTQLAALARRPSPQTIGAQS